MPSLDWRARNYSEFWGKKLSEGVQLRLGTLNPSNSVSVLLQHIWYDFDTTKKAFPIQPIDRFRKQGLQNELGATDLWSRIPAPRIRCQDSLAATDFGRRGSRLVRRIVGDFYGTGGLGQICRDEQRYRQRSSERATFALVQQKRAKRLRRRLLGQSLAVLEKIRVIFCYQIYIYIY